MIKQGLGIDFVLHLTEIGIVNVANYSTSLLVGELLYRLSQAASAADTDGCAAEGVFQSRENHATTHKHFA